MGRKGQEVAKSIPQRGNKWHTVLEQWKKGYKPEKHRQNKVESRKSD